MWYGIFWGGNSPHSNCIFRIQIRILRIIMKAAYRVSCCPLFTELNILSFHSQYMFSLSTFVVKDIDALKSNSAIHSFNTRQGFDLHPPTTN
jgi:hypothetical protein